VHFVGVTQGRPQKPEYLQLACSPTPTHIGVGAQSTLGEHKFFSRKICMKNQQNARILHDSCPKNYQNTRIFMIFAGKIYKISEFYIIFAGKNSRILRNNCPKNIFSRILGGHVLPPPGLPSPTPYAHSPPKNSSSFCRSQDQTVAER